MKILFFGDSITDMGRLRREQPGDIMDFGNGYVNVTCAELAFKEPNKYEFINRGISGNRVIELYDRFHEDVIAYKPDVVSILIGVNDVWHGIYDKSKKVPYKKYIDTYRKMLSEIKEALPGVKFMILEPFIERGLATEDRWNEFTAVYKYARGAKKIAKEFNAVFVPLQKEFDKHVEKYGVAQFAYDGVHPYIGGAKLISNCWLKAFKKL